MGWSRGVSAMADAFRFLGVSLILTARRAGVQALLHFFEKHVGHVSRHDPSLIKKMLEKKMN